jgi:hypothetical protein
MKQRNRVLGPTLGLYCAVAQLYSQPSRAEDASAAETAAARSLAVEGLKLAQANNCADAMPKLERAEKLYHSAVVASRLGECYVSIGHLVEGTEILRKVLREPLPAEPPAALLKALDRAQRTLDTAKPRIAGLSVKVASVQNMSVKIDGTALPSALVDTEIPTDPGEHSIEVFAPGFMKSGTRISVGDGEKKTVTLTLSRDPNAAVLPAAAAAVPTAGKVGSDSSASTASNSTVASSSSAPAERAPNRTAAYISLGFGAAGLVAGGVLGLLTIKKHQDLQSQCPNNVCGRDQQHAFDSAKRFGNLATIAFGVGGAGLLLGSVLFFTASPNNADHASNAVKARFAGLSALRVAVGPGQIRLGADF